MRRHISAVTAPLNSSTEGSVKISRRMVYGCFHLKKRADLLKQNEAY